MHHRLQETYHRSLKTLDALTRTRQPLLCWYEEAVKAQWRRPSDIKSNYVHASFCANNRVVFNIAGNRYRLVVEVQYQACIVWIKFVGTHEQYNRIDVEKVHAH